ncbi:MAG: hypothetical protein ACT4PM_04445 [Gemmatimonadales bacterium]
MFGETYRNLWTALVVVARADLGRLAGGVEAVARDNPSRPFLLKAADGRSFGFRALVKDATLDWVEHLRTPELRWLAREQISGTIPAGSLVVARLNRAAGVLDPGGELVVLPDDPRLNEFRAEFANRIGVLEPRLRDSEKWLALFPGARELVSSDSLFVRLRTDPLSRVDAAGFLAARLVDLLVGDWDRYGGQWTWARFDERGVHRWVPIPSDRDWAFNRLDGLAWSMLRRAQPKFQKLDGRFTGWSGLLLMPVALDRRLLASLDRAAWDSVVKQLVVRLDDRAIAKAVAALPRGMDSAGVTWLANTLRERRDRLPIVAEAWYHKLAGVVEVWGTDSTDRVRLESGDFGRLRVRLERGGTANRWEREFHPGETHEVRVYLLQGDDRIEGTRGESPIRVRIVQDSSRHLPAKTFDSEEIFRDWGRSIGLAPWISHRTGMGLILGGGPVLTAYGFERVPYAYRISLRAGYSFGTSALNADFLGDFRFARPGLALQVGAEALPGDAIHFFGIGNATPRTEPTEFYTLRQESYRIEPRLVFGADRRIEASVGGTLRVRSSDTDRPSLAGAEQPYGFGNFTEIGLVAGLDLDGRDHEFYPVLGARAHIEGGFFPAVADVTAAFGTVHGVVSGYLGTRALPGTPVLAVRGGIARGLGNLPFFEAPALGEAAVMGGPSTLRGFSSRRFQGDEALYGSAELRTNFGWFKLVVPGEWGLYALGDIGRVRLEDQPAGSWHTAGGGGLWVGFVERRAVVTVTFARGEASRLYLAGGYQF